MRYFRRLRTNHICNVSRPLGILIKQQIMAREVWTVEVKTICKHRSYRAAHFLEAIQQVASGTHSQGENERLFIHRSEC